jgi:hypothetical protein
MMDITEQDRGNLESVYIYICVFGANMLSVFTFVDISCIVYNGTVIEVQYDVIYAVYI